VIKREHGKNPAAAAQTIDADAFASQVSRSFDLRMSHEHAGQAVNEAGDEN